MYCFGGARIDPRVMQFWYEAEQDWKEIVKRVMGVLQDWFMAMESGEADYRFPAPDAKTGIKHANKLVSVLDAYFEEEIGKNPEYHGRKMETWPDVPRPPEFSRLLPHARIALFEDLILALEGNGNE